MSGPFDRIVRRGRELASRRLPLSSPNGHGPTAANGSLSAQRNGAPEAERVLVAPWSAPEYPDPDVVVTTTFQAIPEAALVADPAMPEEARAEPALEPELA